MTNTSGISPTEFNVLIEPVAVEEKTAGGIFIPPAKVEKDEFAQTRGRIVAVSPLAFNYATPDEWTMARAEKPKAGDLVLYSKHTGTKLKGIKDGKDYVYVKDRDIVATIED